MYLKNIIIENIGPIGKIDIEMPFFDTKRPKPIIFVGENGSGKTIVLSSIIDALHEIANQSFDDVLPKKGLGYSYFKLVGPKNQKMNTIYGFNYLVFQGDTQKIEYIEKTGKLSFDNCKKATHELLSVNEGWQEEENYKKTTNVKNNIEIQNDFSKNSYCYFPSIRYENPHWLNEYKEESRFVTSSKISGKLGKPVVIEKSLEINKSWLLDIFLDSRADIDEETDQQGNITYKAPDLLNVNLLRQSRKNIEKMLSEILCKEIFLATNYRGSGVSRLKIIDRNKKDILPSLDNFSLGQSVLFNLFATLIRYSDQNNPNKSIKLEDIQGIAVIDEIDAHLHTDLQKNVLPKLIALFPNVQFIITTHAPLFLLGMEKSFDSENYLVYELPQGSAISTERFSEFEEAYEAFIQTKKHDNELEKYLNGKTRPIVFVEGDYDIRYLKKAGELLTKTKLLGSIEFKDAEGFGNLDKVWKHFDSKLSEITPQKILLLYDCDTKKTDCNKSNIFKKVIPPITTNPIQRGIENLFSRETIDKAIKFNSNFIDHIPAYKQRIRGVEQDSSEVYEVNKDEKSNLCHWICENGTKDDFVYFSKIFGILEEVLGKLEENSPPFTQ